MNAETSQNNPKATAYWMMSRYPLPTDSFAVQHPIGRFATITIPSIGLCRISRASRAQRPVSLRWTIVARIGANGAEKFQYLVNFEQISGKILSLTMKKCVYGSSYAISANRFEAWDQRLVSILGARRNFHHQIRFVWSETVEKTQGSFREAVQKMDTNRMHEFFTVSFLSMRKCRFQMS